ncbi:F-box/FBD/LRR-repeat protein At4g26340-like [Cicer arietinum]|uniref:F-box/FBD/LRR-repeat protein At4g26340-like n=1 Tax=Cicer arietinum TaxID=3827 RepID=UPI000640CA13
MADTISDLPDSILCHILSFLPTKHAATTSILSKRWKPLWLSVLNLNFDDEAFENYKTFRKFVYLITFSLRDKTLPIHSFRFKCSAYNSFQPNDFNPIFNFVMQRGLRNLNLIMFHRIKLPTCIFSFKTLEELKLSDVQIGDFDQRFSDIGDLDLVDFPRVKTLHLIRVYFKSPKYVAKFLLGFPNLEDLNTELCVSRLRKSLLPIENLDALPNLVKARICDSYTPMCLVCNAKILHVEELLPASWTRLPLFNNLTHMKLSFNPWFCYRDSMWLLEKLQQIPKLQHITIIQDCKDADIISYKCSEDLSTVPECLSSHLKTCCITGFRGSKHEFEFVKYIMQHSKVLETMTFKSISIPKFELLMKLSSCTKGSATCKLLFD